MASHDVIRESETELHCVCLRTWRVATSRPLPNIVQRVGIIARSCFIIAPAIGCHFYGWFWKIVASFRKASSLTPCVWMFM